MVPPPPEFLCFSHVWVWDSYSSLWQVKTVSQVEYPFRFQRTDRWLPVYTWLESLNADEVVKSKDISDWLSDNPKICEQLCSRHSRYHLTHYIKKCHSKILKRQDKLKVGFSFHELFISQSICLCHPCRNFVLKVFVWTHSNRLSSRRQLNQLPRALVTLMCQHRQLPCHVCHLNWWLNLHLWFSCLRTVFDVVWILKLWICLLDVPW